MRKREPELSPAEQEHLLRESARRNLEFVPKNHNEGTRARRLIGSIGAYCRERTFLAGACASSISLGVDSTCAHRSRCASTSAVSEVLEQKRAVGAIWLDKQLIVGGNDLGERGSGTEVREALRQRSSFLIERGLAERRGERVILARNLLATLRERDIEAAALRSAK